MKLALAFAVSFLALGTMTHPTGNDEYAAQLRTLLAQEQERTAVIALCAEQDASAFQHLRSRRFICAGGSGRIASPLSSPILESP